MIDAPTNPNPTPEERAHFAVMHAPQPTTEEKLAARVAETIREAVLAEREACARLHDNISPACSHEDEHGDPGAGAMGVLIAYRDAIRGRPSP